MDDILYYVFVKLDGNKCVTNIESSLTLTDTTNYYKIDEGSGDRYVHAQSNYFNLENGEKPLTDNNRRPNYKYVNGKLIELTNEEKERLFPVEEPELSKTEIQAELINCIILDNLNMQIQIDELITNGLGGN